MTDDRQTDSVQQTRQQTIDSDLSVQDEQDPGTVVNFSRVQVSEIPMTQRLVSDTIADVTVTFGQ